MMKHNIKYVISLVFMLLLTQSTWADPTVTIIKKLNGAATTSAGTVADPVIANGKCTLTVTPASDYYVTKDNITAYSVVVGNVAQTPRRSPNLDNDPIEVRNAGTNTDPSGVTTYELTMPTDGSDVEVTVDFQSRISIADAVITLAETSYTYDGTAKEPAVSSVKVGETTLNTNEYSVSYSNNTAVGNSATVTVTGQHQYTGTATTTFTISAKSIIDDMITLSASSFEYNGNSQVPTVTVTDGATTLTINVDYTISYEKINNDETTTQITQENVKAVGSYNVVVTGKGNFTGTASATFNIINRTLIVGAEGDVQFASEQNWATYYSADGDVELPEGIGAFVATGVSDGVVTVSQIKNIPEGVAVLLNNATETAGTVAFDPEEDTNLLKHASEDISTSTGNALFYGLYNGEMWRVTGTIPAGKNYIKLLIGMNNEPQAPNLTIVIEGESSTTGVNDVRSKMDDVRGDYFDLQGRKLQQKPSKKGLYIHNGKKVVVNNK